MSLEVHEHEITPASPLAEDGPVDASALSPCRYTGSNGVPCAFMAPPGRTCCFWHDPDADKTNPLVGPLLLRLAALPTNFEGFQLKGVDLECRDLRRARLVYANLENAHLFRTDLGGASMFGANLRNACLFKASLADANLRTADFTGANLIGTRLRGARLEGAIFGKDGIVTSEIRARHCLKTGRPDDARKHFQEADEIYLEILNNHRAAGRQEEAGETSYRLMRVKHELLPKWTAARWASRMVDIMCGYGERPARVVLFFFMVTMLCAVFYFLFGVTESVTGEYLGYDSTLGFATNFDHFLNCVYFSVLTITTTGYGDIIPAESSRGVAAAESFVGAFIAALFVLVLSRKMMR